MAFSKMTSDDQVRERLVAMACERDGAAKLAKELPQIYSPSDVAPLYAPKQRIWESLGAVYLENKRPHEAANIFWLLYLHLLRHQEVANERVHKGVPLFHFASCQEMLGNVVTAKRFFMLTLCEDAIKDSGQVNLNDSGSYFKLVWHFGLGDAELRAYVKQVWDLHSEHDNESRFPEWLLQNLDQN
ncbi:MAG: hypothetical protein K8R36_01510 [Planctomycetales bacterium]|nr:hypothetical protein [Planctomycetales bacterium]